MRLTFVGCGEPDPSVVANAPATSATFALAALAALVISALRPPSRACDCVAVVLPSGPVSQPASSGYGSVGGSVQDRLLEHRLFFIEKKE